MADILHATRTALDNAGMSNKGLSYAARYNYFFTEQNRPGGSWVRDD